MPPATSKKRSAIASKLEHAAAPSRTSIQNNVATANNTIPATQMAFGMSHIVVYQELMTMRRTLDDISRRQENSDETTKTSEARLQELQPMPKRLDDLGAELNNLYSAAEDKIRKQEDELRALANRLLQSDEERVALNHKVQQLVTKHSLQATQEDSDSFRVVARKRARAVDRGEDASTLSESEQQPKKSRFSLSNIPKPTVGALPVIVTRARPVRPKTSKLLQTRFETFQRYARTKMDEYERNTPENGNKLRGFINRFIEGIENEGISTAVQNKILEEYPASTREIKRHQKLRFIGVERGLRWDDVCRIVDDQKLQENVN
ncbi:hypothetical protein CORC01_03334 [Colletotrichum orchidophilum]|uniref:Uncharacterized protein n=1 Tax=Colletotrichum orchidophilum TaxID=1209926 RepID=A0A1G4BIQ3_9PEZI|nr:uncharacterized protein CORC01_03334 [Colletotrichum orchidophilum]OHF01301.1 hypothetical protein CORC01_03334 [Colletotrichum orchidophilum]